LIKDDVLAQNLFDDCFKITDGPDAPYMDVIEMENELVLNLTYVPSQNNYRLGYSESPARLRGFGGDSTYNFQGYKVYQVVSENISVTDLENPEILEPGDEMSDDEFIPLQEQVNKTLDMFKRFKNH
jgi:hypothetical protein